MTDVFGPTAPNPTHQLSTYRPFSRSRTTYGGMNEWMKMQGNVIPSGIPVTHSDGNWRKVPVDSQGYPQNYSQTKGLDDFEKSYLALTKQIAYRYPTPGLPRQREGRLGGTLRHVKEVLTDAGTRTVFMDGLVRVYDQDKFSNILHDAGRIRRPVTKAEPYRPQMPPTPQWSVNRHDVSSYKRSLVNKWEKQTYKPWYSDNRPMPLPACTQSPINHLTRQTPSLRGTEKHRGFYATRT